jgi:hypothetical protein
MAISIRDKKDREIKNSESTRMDDSAIGDLIIQSGYRYRRNHLPYQIQINKTTQDCFIIELGDAPLFLLSIGSTNVFVPNGYQSSFNYFNTEYTFTVSFNHVPYYTFEAEGVIETDRFNMNDIFNRCHSKVMHFDFDSKIDMLYLTGLTSMVAQKAFHLNIIDYELKVKNAIRFEA